MQRIFLKQSIFASVKGKKKVYILIQENDVILASLKKW